MELSATCVGPPVDHLVEVEIGDSGGLSVYDPSTGKVHVFNGTASDTWCLCDGRHVPDEIVRFLARAYRVDEDDIRPAVLTTVQLFIDQKLLRGADGAV